MGLELADDLPLEVVQFALARADWRGRNLGWLSQWETVRRCRRSSRAIWLAVSPCL